MCEAAVPLGNKTGPLQDNAPVINLATDWAGAVPHGIVDWTVLEGWQGPTRPRCQGRVSTTHFVGDIDNHFVVTRSINIANLGQLLPVALALFLPGR